MVGEEAVCRRLAINSVCVWVCVCVHALARAVICECPGVCNGQGHCKKVCVRAGGHIFLCVSIFKCVNAQLCGYVVSAHISVCGCEPKCAKG